VTKEQLEAFLEIVRCGSISAAAEKFFITQPALSRRISVLEEELGYTLFCRQKGNRKTVLTPAGKVFLPIARRSLLLWKEAVAVPSLLDKAALNITAVSSITDAILASVFKNYLAENPSYKIRSTSCHAMEGYRYVERGSSDVALVTRELFFANITAMPAFREKMVLVTNKKAGYPPVMKPRQLDPSKELRIPWMLEYDDWHDKWFPPVALPMVYIDQLSILEDFLNGENWSIMPISAAKKLYRKDVIIGEILNPPPDRVTYYLQRRDDERDTIRKFLTCLHQEISHIEGVTSYLK
jgi:DNA-binding transcriptional LysR family regulator